MKAILSASPGHVSIGAFFGHYHQEINDKTFEGEKFCGFHNFLLDHECFTSNSSLAIDIHY